MKNLLISILLVACTHADKENVPVYKYRYETEDVMKSAASNIPLHGYHVVEGGYYPEERFGRSTGGLGGRYSSGIGQGAIGGGYSGGISQGAIGGGYSGGISQGGFGGGYYGGISQDGIGGGYSGGIGQIGIGGGYSGGISHGDGYSSGISQSGIGSGYSGGIGQGGYSSGISQGGYSGGISQGGLGYGRGVGRFENGDIGYGGNSIGNVDLHGGVEEIGLNRGNVHPRFIGGPAGIRSHGGIGIGGGSGYGVGRGFGIGHGIGIGGASNLGIGGGSGLVGVGGHQGYGGEIVDKTVYNGEKKNLNDESYEKIDGKKGEVVNEGEKGFSQGKVGLLNSKGDSAYYNDEQGGKKIAEDGKTYSGGDFYDQQGKNADEKNQKSGHKKGHVVKGFKSSHHKDETGRTEEYYDEANDEGDNFNFHGRGGKFGEGSQSSFKGGHDNSQFNADEQKKQGHYDSEEFINKNNAGQGQYGQKKYIGNGQVYGVNNGVDQQSLLGHQESSRIFKNHPYYVPFYH